MTQAYRLLKGDLSNNAINAIVSPHQKHEWNQPVFIASYCWLIHSAVAGQLK